MTTWPNWVDLVIVIIIFRTCYSGFGRGFLAELLTLAGAVGVTVLVVNYAGLVIHWLKPWLLWPNPAVAAFLVFWVLFLGVVFVWHRVLKVLTTLIRWERVHWLVQGLGMVVGGMRGLWWAGVLLVTLVSSGVTYLRTSVEERSVLGPRLVMVASQTLQRVADQCPGADYRGEVLVPPMLVGSK